MKFSLALLAAAAATIVSAQDSSATSSLPACANSCATQGLQSTACKQGDIKCICSDSKFISSIASCVSGKCSSDELKSTTNFAVSLCKGAGVTIPQSVIDSITSTASSASPSSAPTNGSAPVSPSTTSNSTPSAGGTVATNTPGAASQFGVSALALGAAALAAFVL